MTPDLIVNKNGGVFMHIVIIKYWEKSLMQNRYSQHIPKIAPLTLQTKDYDV